MKKRFGKFYQTALEGNSKADKLTQQITNRIKVPNCPVLPQRFILKVNGVISQGNILNTIHHLLKEQDELTWHKTVKGKTLLAALSEKSDFELSCWPLNAPNTSKIYRSLTTFKHKLLTGLPTRNAMMKRKHSIAKATMNNKSETMQKYFKVKFSSTSCVRCKADIENTEHVFNCPKNTQIWQETTEKCKKILLEKAAKKVNHFPAWFGIPPPPLSHKDPPRSPVHEAMLNYNKDWGNKSIIPAAAQQYLKQDLKLPTEKVKSVLEKWSKILTKTCFTIWTTRCKELHEWTEKELKNRNQIQTSKTE